jgi:conjugal transfer pilus assembly protein TraU
VPGKGPLDLAYLTEVDPLWADDELAAILNPEAVLFANVVAKRPVRPTASPPAQACPWPACSGVQAARGRSTR